MHCNCAMTSPCDISPVENEGTDVDGADRDGAEREVGATESNYCDLNCASLRFTIAASMVHMIGKWLEEGKGREKWHKIRMIAKGK